MIDPLPQNLLDYDSRASCYDAGLTADRQANMPLTVQPGSSLVSKLGLESSHATYGRSFLRSAAVLTVLDAEPPEDAFRPPYCFGPKPLFRFSDVDICCLPGFCIPYAHIPLQLRQTRPVAVVHPDPEDPVLDQPPLVEPQNIEKGISKS